MTPARALLDITRPVRAGMPVWPGDAPCRLRWTARRDAGDAANVAELCLSVHTGTHVDAPHHVLDEGARIGALAPETFVGPALVVEAGGLPAIGVDLVAGLRLEAGDRVLFRTGCWRGDEFPAAFPALHPEAAGLLRSRGVRLVGTDAPSVDPFDSAELPAHRVLLGAGIPILENLLLDGAEPGRYELVALPLRLEEADASPVRALLRAP
jgi:arylformamidase